MKILVLCTGNSCRSQMMEGFLKQYAPETTEIYSAGIEAHGLNPRAVSIMAEIGIDIANQSSDLVSRFLNRGIDHVITVCDHAAQVCPVFPEDTRTFHHSFPDPAKAKGNEEEIMNAFREVRDAIAGYSKEFIQRLSPA